MGHAVGIKFDDQSVNTSGVQVRKGRGAPMVVGGGGVGIVGLIIFVLINVLGGGGGIDTSGLFVPQDGSVASEGEDAGDLQTRCNTEGAIEQYNDCFLVKVYNEINEVWDAELTKRNDSYEQPALAFFTQGVSTKCGQASSQVGPFYCPGDRTIYLDIGFLQQLQKEFGAEGRYAQAYILAHEAGPPPADAVRHRAEGPQPAGGEPQEDATSSPSPSSFRPTATRVSGANWRTWPETSRSGTPRCSRPRTRPRPSAMTASRRRPRVGWTRSPGPTAAPRTARSGSTAAARGAI